MNHNTPQRRTQIGGKSSANAGHLSIRTGICAGGKPEVCYQQYVNCIGDCAKSASFSQCMQGCTAAKIKCLTPE